MITGTVADAGGLFALCDPAGQPIAYQRCVEALRSLPLPLITTWAALAEAFYLTRKRGGEPMARLLADLLKSGQVIIHELTTADFSRADALMVRYADTPMDLADATLMLVADDLGATRIFSLDSDFYIYRTASGGVLEVLPGPSRQ